MSGAVRERRRPGLTGPAAGSVGAVQWPLHTGPAARTTVTCPRAALGTAPKGVARDLPVRL